MVWKSVRPSLSRRPTVWIGAIGFLASMIVFLVGATLLIAQFLTGEPDDSPSAWFVVAMLLAVAATAVVVAARRSRS